MTRGYPKAVLEHAEGHVAHQDCVHLTEAKRLARKKKRPPDDPGRGILLLMSQNLQICSFPEMVPPNHPLIDGILYYKPSIWGHPQLWKPPHGILMSFGRGQTSIAELSKGSRV